MTDSEYKKQKLRVSKYLDKWQKPAGFGWFKLDVEFDRSRDDEISETVGKCWSNWQYRTGTIRFYLPIMINMTDYELELAVIHELCHLLVAPLQNFESDENRKITEYTTSCVADALYWAHTQVKKGRNDGSKKAPNSTKKGNEPRELQSRQDIALHETANLQSATRRTSCQFSFSGAS